MSHAPTSRLGTQYRLSSFRAAHLDWTGDRILDVGCHQGEFLASTGCRVRVGVDIEPQAAKDSICFVQADGRHLPFRSGCFNRVVGLDVIEHVLDGKPLVQEMLRVSSPGGELFLTTPSAKIRMFPHFLTGWISKKWGHDYRRGYTESEVMSMAEGQSTCSVSTWNAPGYRMAYLLIRLLAVAAPSVSLAFVDGLARWDAAHPNGRRGFIWMRCRKL